MTKQFQFIMVGVVCTAWLSGSAWAFKKPGGDRLPNFDQRQAAPAAAEAAPAGKQVAAAGLRAGRPDVRVDFDPVSGSPKWLASSCGFLTGPAGQGLAADALAGLPARDPHRTIKGFVRQHRPLLGHGPEVLASARLARDDVTPPNGLRTVIWEQRLDELPVFEARFIAHLTRDDNDVPDLPRPCGSEVEPAAGVRLACVRSRFA